MKILGFDSWARGAYHFNHLVPAFKAKGMSLRLVHLGSWGNDPGRPAAEQIDQLEVRDITYYKYRSLDDVLDAEKPDAVIFLSTHTFAHKALNRFCFKRNIPTLIIYHGLVSVQLVGESNRCYKVNKLANLCFIFKKLGKTFRYTLPCYIDALLKTKASARDWGRFFKDMVHVGKGTVSYALADDARTTRCCIYSQADIDDAVTSYGFAASDIIAVGNPDLVQFGFKEEMMRSQINCSGLGRREIIYIDTGLAPQRLIFRNTKEFVRHLRETNENITRHGMKMLFKPHYNHDIGFLAKELAGSNIEFIDNNSVLKRLQDCAACIVETTSLAIIPALMGMPLFYANYGKLAKIRFGPVLTSYPRGYMIRNIADLSDLLRKDNETFDAEAVEKWIASNAGPLPAEEMPHRVAAVVEELVRKQHRSSIKCAA